MTIQEILDEIEIVQTKLLAKPGVIESVELTDLLFQLYETYVYRTRPDDRKKAA